MKLFAILLFASVAALFADDIPLDPEKPPLLKPSSVYAFNITPSEGIDPVTIRLHTEAGELR